METAAIPSSAAPRSEVNNEQHFRYWSPWLGGFLAAWTLTYLSAAPQPLQLFVHNWVFIGVGFCGALLGNISAVGGGIVFIPVMIFLFHFNAVDALKIALASQVFGMSSGAMGWAQKRVIPMQALHLTVPGLLIGSAIGSLLIHPSALLVKVLFGPVSISLGLLTIILARRGSHADAPVTIPPRAAGPLFITSVIGGLITGWIAIGEGEVVAALLMLVYGLNASTCIGLGVLLLAINSIFLTLIHQFFLGGIPWSVAGFTGLGCVFGARLAPYLSRKSNPIVLKFIFATIAISDGALFIVQYLLMRASHR